MLYVVTVTDHFIVEMLRNLNMNLQSLVHSADCSAAVQKHGGQLAVMSEESKD